jgi:hypothetical protein
MFPLAAFRPPYKPEPKKTPMIEQRPKIIPCVQRSGGQKLLLVSVGLGLMVPGIEICQGRLEAHSLSLR